MIELLVVIAIIALLLAIILPSVKRVQLLAKKAFSMNNMRQIGMAMSLYTDDNAGLFPESTHTASKERSWIFTLAPYLSEVDEIRIDPADPKRKERLENNMTSYVLNEYIVSDDFNTDPFGNTTGPTYRNARKLKIPAKTITVFVCSDDTDVTDAKDHVHSTEWFDGSHVPIDEIKKDIQIDRYGTTTLFLYADPHVESVKSDDITKMAGQNYNFAEPPH